MPNFKNFKDLMKYIEKEAKDTLKKEVAQKAVDTMREHVQTDVYDVYEPHIYKRTGELMRDVQVEIDNNDNLILTNETYHDGKEITPIIESGKGYSFSGYGYAYEQPRPFVENTYKEFQKTGSITEEMKKGLKTKGMEVK